MIKDLYSKVILGHPKFVLLFISLMISFLAYESFNLKVDASAKTLLLEDDKDLAYTRVVAKRYKTKDLLVIAYTPKKDLLDDTTLNNIRSISSDLRKIKYIDSVDDITNIPLLQTSELSFAELAKGAKTLSDKDINKQKAKHELLNNPLYVENFVSKDFKTTAIMIHLKDKNTSSSLSKDINHRTILGIRSVINKHSSEASMFLGGANMIADDMITYVKNDLKTYGAIVLLLLVVILYIVFKEIKWVLVPLAILFGAIVSSMGLLGLFNWEVTVVSSNFISFQLILTTSIIIHLVVRYRELASKTKDLNQKELVLQTVSSMSKPTFFAVITTVAGFSSLMLSGILPVINLGWMMSTSLLLSFFITYAMFGSIMILLKPSIPNKSFEANYDITRPLSYVVQKHYMYIFVVSLIIILFSISGATKLIVENSFINYFKPSTEIYQGMSIVDNKLGGTTPLDVTIDLVDDNIQTDREEIENSASSDFLDEFEDEFDNKDQENQYWFTSSKMQKIQKIHNYLESIDELGKVLSFATILKVGKSINQNQDLDNFQLALLYNEFPDKLKKQILRPYLNIDANQVRFNIRVVDSNPDLRRGELINRIKTELHEKLGIKKEHIHLSGLMLLYNNMLQSLFNSQILTIGVMVILLFAMFWALFRSFTIGLAAILANIIPIGIVFGFMGWLNIPLDMMTITIASISIGIAVDDTIHYLFRYRHEYAKCGDYTSAMRTAHTSIGHAMTYTSLAISIGFLVLVLSAFTPTIYFGLLTVVVMLVALATDMLLLPRLVMSLDAFRGLKRINP